MQQQPAILLVCCASIPLLPAQICTVQAAAPAYLVCTPLNMWGSSHHLRLGRLLPAALQYPQR